MINKLGMRLIVLQIRKWNAVLYIIRYDVIIPEMHMNIYRKCQNWYTNVPQPVTTSVDRYTNNNDTH